MRDDKKDVNADALEALASGRQFEPAEPGEEQAPSGPSSGLMLLSDGGEAPDAGTERRDAGAAEEPDDASTGEDRQDTAAESPAADGDDAQQADDSPPVGQTASAGAPLEELTASAAAETPPGDVLGQVASASAEVLPAIQPRRAARLQANIRRSHAQAYKRAMIPVLLVVGVLLLAFGAFTLVMLIGQNGQSDEIVGRTYLQVYGKYFILAALPLGAILILGAWLFYLDVKRTEPPRPR
ncbi:MAG: hypothetical protein J7M21_06190 [Planctomycetes bacterium]|nr:hypothetical protein [Planctomycetota bacterium]